MSLLSFLALAASAALSSSPQPPVPDDCSALAASGASFGASSGASDLVVDRATTIRPDAGWKPDAVRGSYTAVPVAVPFCRVEGRIEGSIGFELWLPAQWNGRLLGAGVGGDAGVFNYRDLSLRIAQGFAAVTTDSGHKASDARWMRLPKARVDYEHRAVHLTAQAAKAIAARFYNRPVNRAYFTGCSGGGRQALKEMQTYPGDYDGVIAGAPGPYMPLQSVRMLWFALEQQRHPAGMLADADWALYERRATDFCDGLDGVKDGVVQNPLSCRFPTATLLCRPGQGEGCLSAPKLAMLREIIAPMPDERGRPMDKGLFPGVRTRPGPPSPLLRAMWADAVYDNPDWDATTFRRTDDLAAANRVMPELRADRTAIAPFIARGAKAILYQGWQDPSTNAAPTIDYYTALARDNGGLARLAQSVRLFMVPGMYHCRGGPGADLFGGSAQVPASGLPESDMLWALIRWVEQGAAPQAVVASRATDATPVFTRPLCPFPAVARFSGHGEWSDARNWQCQSDNLLTRWRPGLHR